jgi:prevent-host-death family protein
MLEYSMQNMSAHEAKARFGQLLEMARSEPVVIEKHGRGVAVVISKEEFDAVQELKLENLRFEIQKGLDDLNTGRSIEVDSENIQAFAESIKSRGRKRQESE